jgi:hypothetical protein
MRGTTWLVGGVRFQPVETLALSGFPRVWVRPCISEPVPVWWPPALISPLDAELGRHGGAGTHLDAVALTLTHAPEYGHDEIVRLVLWIDRSADLGNPEWHAVMHEEREGVSELIPVEGALWLTDHNCVEATFRITQGF